VGARRPAVRVRDFDRAQCRAQHAAPLLSGITSSRDARDALRRLANDAELVDKVELIPDHVVDPAAIVTAALAPLLGEPKVSARG